jgi:hypothetical protein
VLDDRRRRIAENEARFREINDRLEQDLRRLPVDGDPVAFVCECGHVQCTDHVHVSLPELAEVRQERLRFVVLPGHEIDDVEDVVARTDRYVVVRKHEDAAPVVEPRR